MSNSVSKFIYSNNTLPNNDSYNQYFLIADNYQGSAHISFDTLTLSTCVSVFHNDEWLHIELTKEQITQFLSLDCPDAFIAYALTLCSCSPEIPLTESGDDAVQVGKNEGNLLPPSPETSSCAVKCELDDVKGDSFIKSYSKKQDITYLQALKDIKAQIEFLNKCAFDKSILTSDEHFALLGIEEELQQLIHFDPVRPADDGLPLRYDHFNCHALPNGLE